MHDTLPETNWQKNLKIPMVGRGISFWDIFIKPLFLRDVVVSPNISLVRKMEESENLYRLY